MTETTYVVELDFVDNEVARYTSPAHAATLDLPREKWIQLGRPGVLEFTPRSPR